MNIFSRLEKYKPSAKVTPEENFFTEGFAYLLTSDKKLAKEVFRGMGILINEQTVISTQQMLPPSSYIDLYIENEGSRALVEIKLAADLNKYENEIGETYDQLTKYSAHIGPNDKVILFAYDADIERIKSKKYSFKLAYRSWEQIHTIMVKHQNKSDLTKQFITFMEAKSMNQFSGLKEEFFLSIGAKNDFSAKADSAIRKQFNELCQEIFANLKKKEKSWKVFIYSYDTLKKRYYCHFQNPESNRLGLNINVEATPNGIGVLVWIPYWKFRESSNLKDQGKINSLEICKLLDHFKANQNDLKEKLHDILNGIDSNYHISLHVKQYEHIKTSQKKAQGMQKGHDVELLKLNKGNTLIPSTKDNTLMIDQAKEVYDDTKSKTSIDNISKSQVSALVELLYEKDTEYSNLKSS